jgi:Helix-turn-helix domain
MTRQSQSDRILAALRDGPKTTAELVIGLRIMSVTKRISELRRDGADIRTTEQWNKGVRIVTYRLFEQRKLEWEQVA